MTGNQREVYPPSWLWTAAEVRTFFELGTLFVTIPLLQSSLWGAGRPVMVIPGFGTGDWSSVPLRWFLKNRGYSAHGWGLGHNTGYDEKLGRLLSGRLVQLFEKYENKISIIGWSLGGIYARELARWKPEMVRLVITLGSPIRHIGSGTRLKSLYEMVSGKKLKSLEPAFISRLQKPPPVPTSSIYSRTDGITSHLCCREMKTPHTENIEVRGSHCGLVHNPVVLWIIADRLAQSAEGWKPFSKSMMRNIMFRCPDAAD